MNRRWILAFAVLPLALLGVLASPAHPAAAHPLGNFSVNQYDGLALYPDRVVVSAVVDTAEIPTLQEKSTVDSDPAAYPARACTEVANAFEVRVGPDRLMWTVSAPAFGYAPGAGGLSTSRLTCTLTAPAHLDRAASVSVANRYRTDRVGWRELTASGDGVRLVDSPLPATSVSNELRAYPVDLLSSALDVRSATLRVEPGAGGSSTAAATKPAESGTLTRWTAAAERYFQHVAGGRRLTPVVAVLAVLLAVLLGAGHAVLPGHGKTIMAAYLARRRGRIRDAVAVGGTVTLTHTGGVLVVGLLLSTSTAFAGDRILAYLGVASGVLVIAVGIGMLVNLWRRRAAAADHGHHHDHGHDGHDGHHDGHGHHGHDGHHGHGHHGHDGDRRPGGRLGLAGIGLAGGLVPSPSALVVLLGAIGLGRAGFGVLLVVAYGVGMAATLTGAGLLLVVLQRRIARVTRRSHVMARLGARFPAAASTATAGLVVVVGAGLALRAAAGVW